MSAPLLHDLPAAGIESHAGASDALTGLPQHEAREELAAALSEKVRRLQRRRFFRLFPDDGPLRRDLYAQHCAFFALGADVPSRAFMAGNRVGKTTSGAFELTCHLTGRYPHWWTGRRFDGPIAAWCAGDTLETVRDILTLAMIGPRDAEGTGMIPGDDLLSVKYRVNGSGAADHATVRHVSGGVSRLGFKSYDQGRESFQGTAQHVVWLDEESDEGIRAESAMRLMTTHGLLLETLTPLKGLTPNVLRYLGDDFDLSAPHRIAQRQDSALVMAGWDDVPHLGDAEKRRMRAECEPHLRDARSRGIPSLGSGAIYPIPESAFVVDDLPIPAHWARVYGLDVGWNRTAAVWLAVDRDNDTVYVTGEHYRGEAEPSIHADAIKARGAWIPGVIDPASAGASQHDGKRLVDVYRAHGLDLSHADNSVEAGILAVWQRLSSGRLKVFKSCANLLAEYRVYRRDEKGRIVKHNDHALDALRYAVVSGLAKATVEFPREEPEPRDLSDAYDGSHGADDWM